MNRKTLTVSLFILTLGLFAAMDCAAAIYKYTDKDGLITFADDLQAVPVQYRSQAVIVSGEDKEAEVKSPAGQAVPKEQTEIKAGEHMPVLPSSVKTLLPNGFLPPVSSVWTDEGRTGMCSPALISVCSFGTA